VPKPVLTFDEATHSYALDGRPVPGVTSVIREILAPLFRVDSDLMRRAAEFGKAVHRACELDDKKTLDMETLDPALVPWLEGWRKFRAEHPETMWHSETKICSYKFRFAGTLDRISINPGSDQPTLLDIKTSTTIGPEVGIQTAAYKMAAEEYLGIKIKSRLCVQLTEGGYRLHKLNDPADQQTFIAALSCWNWRKKNGKAT
jgi:hypothetical protein